MSQPIDIANERHQLNELTPRSEMKFWQYVTIDALLTELEAARAEIERLREALAAAKLFGNDGETHEGKSVSYMIEKALTGTAGRS